MQSFNQCRFCDSHDQKLIKYGVRHYAHAACGLEAKGTGFFDLLQDWQIAAFPYFVAKDAGFEADLLRRFDAIKAPA